jgi:RimJ/RimL family protein N-acetyltransferase
MHLSPEKHQLMTTPEKSLLYKEGQYTIWRHEGLPENLIEFLEGTNIGTTGAQYEHCNTPEQISHLLHPVVLSVWDQDQMVATAVFCNTRQTVAGHPFNCYYVRYFAASAVIRGRGMIKMFSEKAMRLIRENEKEKTIYHAIIEKGNLRSFKVVQKAGYEVVGVVKTHAFSRFFPKQSSRIERITTLKEKEEVLSLVREQYKNHALFQEDYLFLDNNYFVIRKEGKILAGCQCHRALWKVNGMPGISGKIIMGLIPHTPLLRRIFNPRHFEFLGFEGIYFQPGEESTLQELFEGLLKQESLHSAMFWLDEQCPYRKKILNAIHPGIMQTFVKNADSYVMASYHDLDEKEIESLKSSPLYISAHDCM